MISASTLSWPRLQESCIVAHQVCSLTQTQTETQVAHQGCRSANIYLNRCAAERRQPENFWNFTTARREKCHACQNSVFAFSSFTWLLCWSYYPCCMLGCSGAKIAKNTNAGSIFFWLCLGCLPAWSFSVFAAAWRLFVNQANLMLQIELCFAHQTMQPSTSTVHRTSRQEKLEKNGFLANHEQLNLTAKGKTKVLGTNQIQWLICKKTE